MTGISEDNRKTDRNKDAWYGNTHLLSYAAAVADFADHDSKKIYTIGVRAGLERAAKLIEPSDPRPCDCVHCDCGNPGDTEFVARWDERKACAQAIRALIPLADAQSDAIRAMVGAAKRALEEAKSDSFAIWWEDLYAAVTAAKNAGLPGTEDRP